MEIIPTNFLPFVPEKSVHISWWQSCRDKTLLLLTVIWNLSPRHSWHTPIHPEMWTYLFSYNILKSHDVIMAHNYDKQHKPIYSYSNFSSLLILVSVSVSTAHFFNSEILQDRPNPPTKTFPKRKHLELLKQTVYRQDALTVAELTASKRRGCFHLHSS